MYANSSLGVEPRTCVPCAAGRHYYVASPAADAAECVACAVGTYSDAHASVCETCADGSSTGAATGVSSCTACAAGTYSVGGAECRACAAGTFADAANATSCVACADFFVASAEGATACSACADGSTGDLANRTSCVACAAGFFGSQGRCVICAVGAYSASVGQTRCDACDTEASWCPLGSESSTTEKPPAEVLAAQVVAVDPLSDITTEQRALGVAILWGTACGGIGLILALFALYVYARKRPSVKECFRCFDIAFATKHHVADGEPLVRRDKAIGGFATLATLLVMATLVVSVYVSAVYLPSYEGAMSPLVPPFFPTGVVTLTVRYYGLTATACAATKTAAVTVGDGASFGGGGGGGSSDGSASLSAPTYDSSSRMCTSEWQSASVCTLGVAAVAFTAGSTDAAAYATAIAWQLDFPAYASTAPTTATGAAATTRRFRLSGAIVPARTDLVLQSSSVTRELPQVTVSHIPVLVTKPDGSQLVGSLAQVSASVVASDASVNQTEYSVTTTATTTAASSSFPRIGLVVTVQPSTQVYAVKGAAVNHLQVVGTCASYVTGISLAMGLLMLFFERCFPKHGPSGFRAACTDATARLVDVAACCGRCCRTSCRACGRGGGGTRSKTLVRSDSDSTTTTTTTTTTMRLNPDAPAPTASKTLALATQTPVVTIEMPTLESQSLAKSA
jgi:hypothetical protein